MPDLSSFGLKDMADLGSALRRASAGAHSMEETAQRIATALDAALVDPETGKPQAVLVRVYTTLPYRALPADLQAFARGVVGKDPGPETRCLTLLATTGREPQWCDRRASRGHRAIPLVSEDVVHSAPMISALFSQLGVTVSAALRPPQDLLPALANRTYNVFHVPDARGNPSIPAQEEFVVAHGVRSCIGFGGILASGTVFATILFTRVHVPPETAEMFRTLAISMKAALLPFDSGRIFAEGTG